MLSKHRTSRHNTSKHNGGPKRQQAYMCHPLLAIPPRIPFTLFLPRHLIQILALTGNPVSDVQFIRVDVALCGAVAAEEQDSRE